MTTSRSIPLDIVDLADKQAAAKLELDSLIDEWRYAHGAQDKNAWMGQGQCSHGYLSAVDRTTCICNSGWTGPRCETDAIPSCVRGQDNPCLEGLRFSRAASPKSCDCLAECAEHMQQSLQEFFGEEG